MGVLDALHCGALLLQRGGEILHANARLCEMLGQSAAELEGRHLLELYPEHETRERIGSALRDFEQPAEVEAALVRKDGGSTPAILSGRRLPGPPPMGDYRVVTVIDITRIKHTEERYRDLFTEVSRLSDTILEQAMGLKDTNRLLEEKVRERTAELHEANMDAIYMLALAGETKDLDTGAHVRRIETYARLLAQEIGLPADHAERIGYSAILHDVGKMLVPDAILKKPASLDSDERRRMEEHTLAGERILANKPFFEIARQIARSHHENWDGSGYPDGLRGEQTPLPARIVHLVDVFDALVSQRVYKPSWSLEEALAELSRGEGTLFEPGLLNAFRRVVHTDDVRRIMAGLTSAPGA